MFEGFMIFMTVGKYMDFVSISHAEAFMYFMGEEPVYNFLACLEQHALVRKLSMSTAFWVCAYANNQHCVADDITSNPRSTSFYRAMQMSQGVLLVLDSGGTPFERIWCCFEESVVPRELSLFCCALLFFIVFSQLMRDCLSERVFDCTSILDL